MSKLRQQTLHNSLYNFLTYVAPVVFTIFLTPLIIHRLGVQQYGIFVLASVVVGFFALLRFGLGYGAAKVISKYLGDRNSNGVGEVISSTIFLLATIGIIGALASFFVGLRGAEWFHISAIDAHTVTLLFTVAGIGFFFTSIGSGLTSALSGLQRLDAYAHLYLVGICTMNIGMLIAVSLGQGIVTLIAIQCITYALLTLSYWLTLRRLLPEITFSLRYYHAEFKPYLTLNGYAYVHETAGALLFELDKVLVSAISGPVAISYYNIAGTIAQKIQGAVSSLTAILLPVSSTLSAASEHERLRNVYQLTMRLAAITSTGLALTLVLFARPLLQYWLGAEFVENSLTPLYILAATYFFLALFISASHFLLGLGRARELAGYTSTLAILNILLLAVLLPTYGITGAAWAYLLSLLPLPYFINRIEKNALQIKTNSRFYSVLVWQLFAAGAITAILAHYCLLPWAQNLLTVIIFGGISFMLFIVVYWVCGFLATSEKELLRHAINRYILRKSL